MNKMLLQEVKPSQMYFAQYPEIPGASSSLDKFKQLGQQGRKQK